MAVFEIVLKSEFSGWKTCCHDRKSVVVFIFSFFGKKELIAKNLGLKFDQVVLAVAASYRVAWSEVKRLYANDCFVLVIDWYFHSFFYNIKYIHYIDVFLLC